MHKISVISKQGCHLCERAIKTLQELTMTHKFEMEVLDILSDEKLHDEYWLKIPVVRLDGKDVLEGEDIATPQDCTTRLVTLVSAF